MSVVNSFITAFRNGIKFSERLFRNTVSQGKWTITQSKWAYTEACSLYNRLFAEVPPQAVSIGIGVIVAILAVFLFIPLFVWAIVKSI